MTRRRRSRDSRKSRPGHDQKRPAWTRFAPLLIVVAAGAAYANSFTGAFVFDDKYHVLNNPRILSLFPLWDVLSGARRPVVEVSLAVNYAINAFNVRGYHAFNLIVHILAALTLYGVVRRTFLHGDLRSRFADKARWLALVVALIWVVHPLQTQSVTYVIQRGESLMGLFYLLTLYCVIRGAASPDRPLKEYANPVWHRLPAGGNATGGMPKAKAPACIVRQEGTWRRPPSAGLAIPPRRWWYVAAIVACAMGMGSKAVMLSAPVVVLLYDRTFLGKSLRGALVRRWPLYLGLAATWVVLVQLGIVRGVLSTSMPMTHVGFSYKGVTPLEYLLTQAGVVLHYLKLSLWPHPLCLDYDWPIARSAAQIVPPVIVVAALLSAVLWASWRKPAMGFVGLWFFLILAPSSSFIPIRDLALEHRMYLSLAAVVVLTVLVGDVVLTRFYDSFALKDPTRQRTTAGLAVIIVVTLATMTHQRNKAYQSEIAIWGDVAATRPDNGRARYNLANALLKAGRVEEAIRQSHEAIRIRPDHAPSHYDLGVALDRQGKPDEAIEAYRTALRIDPEHTSARLNVGVLFYRAGDLEAAVKEYQEVTRIDPRHVLAHYNLGNALLKLGRFDEAIEAYRRVVRINPMHVKARMKIGNALVTQGDIESGIGEYQYALRVDPRHPEANYRLGTALLRLGELDEAIRAFQTTLRVQPGHAAAERALKAAISRRSEANTP